MTIPRDLKIALESDRPRLLPAEGKRRAAVAIVLSTESKKPRTLFIERTERKGDPWSGHLAFPGGQQEKKDQSLRDTAERETLEEIGVDLTSSEYLGRLDDVTGATIPVVVSGFVYYTAQTGVFKLSNEVRDAFWVTVEDLLDPERHKEFEFQALGAVHASPAIDLLGAGRPLLWGITYRFVEQFLRLSGCEIPRRIR